MKKTELIEALAEQTETSKADAGRAVEALLGLITTKVAKGEDVTITGFGTFTSSKRSARKARNPRTGEPIKIAATKVPKFRAGANFKAAVAPKKRK